MILDSFPKILFLIIYYYFALVIEKKSEKHNENLIKK